MKIILFFLLFLISPIFSHVAIVKTVKNDVQVKRAYDIFTIKTGFLLNEDDILITGKDSSVGIIFTDGTRLSLGAKSHIVIEKYIYEPEKNNFAFDLNMTKGKAMFESGKFGIMAPNAVEFKVPDGIIGIDGTKFYVDIK
jgi:hypothetical protein